MKITDVFNIEGRGEIAVVDYYEDDIRLKIGDHIIVGGVDREIKDVEYMRSGVFHEYSKIKCAGLLLKGIKNG